MNKFICNLSEFNRKERFYLIGKALGNYRFLLSEEFRNSLKTCLKQLPMEIPDNSFVAMDFHIDWIYGSLFLIDNESSLNLYSLNNAYIKATQEDVDLLIAFPDNKNKEISHVIMCECKAETGWTNKQLHSKSERLRRIFGEDGNNFKNIVIPYFIIMSPKKSKKLDSSVVPEFMKVDGDIPWMNLPLPKSLKKITRCNRIGKNDKDGKYWKVDYT
ncbi:MAG: hypothetical protein Q8M94_16425 [Ignavibacteria bacterium]|nr:hypothetical protein [Ignavibacteria bacterium]